MQRNCMANPLSIFLFKNYNVFYVLFFDFLRYQKNFFQNDNMR